MPNWKKKWFSQDIPSRGKKGKWFCRSYPVWSLSTSSIRRRKGQRLYPESNGPRCLNVSTALRGVQWSSTTENLWNSKDKSSSQLICIVLSYFGSAIGFFFTAFPHIPRFSKPQQTKFCSVGAVPSFQIGKEDEGICHRSIR